MPFTPENAPTAIYRTEYQYMVRGVLCRNTFHHYTEVPGMKAQFINQMVLAHMITEILTVQSAYIAPIALHTYNVGNDFQDAYQYFFEGASGAINATPDDPRLGVYIKIETDHPARKLYTGGCNLTGIGQNWTMDSPLLHEAGRVAIRNVFDLLVTRMGKDAALAPAKWVVFSRVAKQANPNAIWLWSERVSHIGVRRTMHTLRTRRPRIPI